MKIWLQVYFPSRYYVIFFKTTVYVYRTTFSTIIRTFLGDGGGRLLEGGRLLNILSLRRGAYWKGGAYWKLGAYSSIYGKCQHATEKINAKQTNKDEAS